MTVLWPLGGVLTYAGREAQTCQPCLHEGARVRRLQFWSWLVLQAGHMHGCVPVFRIRHLVTSVLVSD